MTDNIPHSVRPELVEGLLCLSAPEEEKSRASTGSARTGEETDSSEEAWDLWRRDPRATVFQSPAWLDAWAEHLCNGPIGSSEARDEAGRLIARLPLFLWDDGAVRRLVPLGAGQSDYCDALVDPEAEEQALAGLFEAIGQAPWEWDELLLPDLRPDSPLLRFLPEGWTARDEPHEVCPVLRFPPGKSFREMLSKSQRRKVTHDGYRADNLGGVTTALARTEELDEALDALFALHAVRWEAVGEPGVLADPRVQAFLRTSVPALDAAGLLRMALARHEGRIVAVLLGMSDGRRGCSYINGVDMSIPGQSFGTLAFTCLIEGAVEEGLSEFHFLRGEEPYKYSWGAEPMATVRRVVRRTR